MTTFYPSSQAFARAPDGGTLTGSPAVTVTVNGQAFTPPANTATLTSEPTAPLVPTEPSHQAFGPVPVEYELLPDYLDVDLSLVVPDTQAANTYVVTEVGNLPTVPQQSIRNATIASVVDYETGLAPSSASVNLRVTLAPGSKPLNTYGADLTGRTIYFTVGAWIPAATTPRRQILVYGPLVLVVSNRDSAGVSFDWAGMGGPGAGTVIAFDVQVASGEVVTDLFPTPQDVVPETTPVEDPTGVLDTLLSVPTYEVGDQELTLGTPKDYFQGVVHPA